MSHRSTVMLYLTSPVKLWQLYLVNKLLQPQQQLVWIGAGAPPSYHLHRLLLLRYLRRRAASCHTHLPL